MDNTLLYLEESVQNELNVSYLYAMFYDYFPEDYQFWWELSAEEVNHASLLRSGKEFYKLGNFPIQVTDEDIKTLSDLNKNFESITENFKKNPTRKNAFEIALMLEDTFGENHYQKFMSSDKDDQLSKIFKKLNKDDMDHETRIRRYIRENNI